MWLGVGVMWDEGNMVHAIRRFWGTTLETGGLGTVVGTIAAPPPPLGGGEIIIQHTHPFAINICRSGFWCLQL